MPVIKLLSRIRTARLVSRLAPQIAREIHLTIFACVERPVRAMTLPEARGYIRARCSDLISEQVELTLNSLSGKDRAVREQLQRASVEAAVCLVIADILKHDQTRVARRHAA